MTTACNTTDNNMSIAKQKFQVYWSENYCYKHVFANRMFGHVTGMGENRNAFRVFMESTNGKR